MPGREAWRSRIALQIASQLPDDPTDALRVLEIAAGLVHYLNRGQATVVAENAEKRVLAFPAGLVGLP